MQIFVFLKKHIGALILHVVCLLGICSIVALSGHMQTGADSQFEAQRFNSSDIKYHQASVFFPQTGLSFDEISNLRNKIQEGLLNASFTSDVVAGRLWIDAYSAHTEGSISKKSEIGIASKDNVEIMGVGGDFFQFHLLDYVSGFHFEDNEVMGDRVVIDTETAWTLFGASDVAGQRVQIMDKSFVIAGVYQTPQDKVEQEAKNKKSYVFMDYDAYQSLYPESVISCYEVVMPSPVKNFAVNLLADNLDENVQIVDNTTRFSDISLWKKYGKISDELMRKDTVVYPYWENQTRALEWKLFQLAKWKLILIGLLVLYWCYVLIRNFTAIKKVWKAIWRGLGLLILAGLQKLFGFIAGKIKKRRAEDIEDTTIEMEIEEIPSQKDDEK